jgi:hypothetical protein
MPDAPPLVLGVDLAVGKDGGLEPVVDALPEAPADLDDRVEENLLAPAAPPGVAAASARMAATDGTIG